MYSCRIINKHLIKSQYIIIILIYHKNKLNSHVLIKVVVDKELDTALICMIYSFKLAKVSVYYALYNKESGLFLSKCNG